MKIAKNGARCHDYEGGSALAGAQSKTTKAMVSLFE